MRDVLKTRSLNLSCKLTEDERNARARQVVAEMEQRAETMERHKETKATMKAEIAAHDTIIGKLQTQASTGYETRLVACDDIADYETGVVRTVRRDTGEIAETRRLQETERQGSLVEPLTDEEAEALDGAPGDDDDTDTDDDEPARPQPLPPEDW
jgi:hypothetical protein